MKMLVFSIKLMTISLLNVRKVWERRGGDLFYIRRLVKVEGGSMVL